MKFVCDRCQTRYSIADEKVRQKILRIRCKTCGNVIVVQDEEPHAAQASPGPADAARAPSLPSPRPPSGGAKGVPASPRPPSSGAKGVPAGGGKQLPPGAPKSPPPPPRPVQGADPLGGHTEWYMAVDGEQSGPFSRSEIAKRIHALGPNRSVHVWKDGMAGWKPPREVSVVVHELSLLRPPPPPPPSGRSSPPQAQLESTPPAPAVSNAGLPLADLTPVELPANAGGFSDVTTKKSKHLSDQVASPGDEFNEATTKKTNELRQMMVSGPEGGYAEATTKKNKNLRDLEAAGEHVAPGGETERTPPPVRPLPPVGARPAPSVAHPAVPLPAPAVSFDAPAGPPATLRTSQSYPVVGPPQPLAGGPHPASPRLQPGASSGGMALAGAALGSPALRTPTPVAVGAAGSFGLPGAPPVPVPSGLPTPRPLDVVPFDGSLLMSAPSAEMQVQRGGLAGLFQRQPGLKYVAAALAIVGLIILLVLVILQGKREPRSDSTGAPSAEPSASVEEKVAINDPAPTPAPAPAPTPAPAPGKSPATHASAGSRAGSGRVHNVAPAVAPAPAPAPARGARDKPQAALPRLAGSKPSTASARPNPFDESRAVSQSQITAVVRNPANQAGLKSCYERALKMDNHLTSGRIDVTASIGASGAVQRVVINAPASFILVEPCIKSAVKRWAFPPNVEEYATSFPLILQGGM